MSVGSGRPRSVCVLARERRRADRASAHVAERLRRQRPRAATDQRERRPLVLDPKRQRRQDLAAQPTRADAVARVADAEVDAAATAEERQPVRRHVDRPAPGALDAHTVEPGEQAAQAGLGAPLYRGVGEEAVVDLAAEPDLPGPGAHQHAAVVGRAEVVEERAPIGERLMPGPADLRERIRRGLGEDDPAAHVRDPVGNRPPAGHPGVRREDDRIRADRPTLAS